MFSPKTKLQGENLLIIESCLSFPVRSHENLLKSEVNVCKILVSVEAN